MSYSSHRDQESFTVLVLSTMVLLLFGAGFLLVPRPHPPSAESFRLEITPSQVSGAETSAQILSQTQDLTLETLRYLRRFEKGLSESEKTRLLPLLGATASRRFANLESLAKNNYKAFLSLTLPAQLRSLAERMRLPVESLVGLSGRVALFHSENFTTKQAAFTYTLMTTRNETFFLSGDFSNLDLGNKEVQLTGLKIGSTVVVADPQDQSQLKILKTSSRPNTFLSAEGPLLPFLTIPVAKAADSERVLAILINFRDDTRTPFMPERVREVLFDGVQSVANYYGEASYGDVAISGDVAGWYTIPYDKRNCDRTYAAWATAAGDAAERAGYDLLDYDRYVIIFPSISGCGWTGAAYIGGFTAWINGALNPAVIAHELGHLFGENHASALQCPGTIFLPRGEGCTTFEYGDPFSVMGATSLFHFNGQEKEHLRWLTSPDRRRVSSSGTYSLLPMSTPGIGTRVLEIPSGSDANGLPLSLYYIEARAFSGFDQTLHRKATEGVLVHWSGFPTSHRSLLLDMHPDGGGFFDAALSFGSTYTDPTTFVSFTPSFVEGEVSVQVTIPEERCVRNKPNATILPTLQEGVGGETRSYRMRVKSNDTTPCGSSDFGTQLMLPRDWSGTVSPEILTLRAGGIGYVILTVTPSLQTPEELYTIFAQVENGGATLSQRTSATYAVIDDAPPVVTIISPMSGDRIFRGLARVVASATDNLGVTKVEFYLNNRLVCTDTTPPDSAPNYSCARTINTKGEHRIFAKAYDTAGNSTVSSLVTIFVE